MITEKKPITRQMRENLEPKGALDVCYVHMNTHYNKEFIWKCIDELEKMPMRMALGDKPSCLEQLAYELLMESAYLDVK